VKTPGPQPGRTTQKAITSPLWEETAGLSAIEQMMRAGVVVVSDIGGLGEVVGDAGLKFAPEPTPSLRTIESLVERPGASRRTGMRGSQSGEDVVPANSHDRRICGCAPRDPMQQGGLRRRSWRVACPKS
jgi:hypothetical protein